LIGLVRQIGRDLAYAVRMIRKMPVMAAVVIGSIGTGIGVNTAVFSWIQSRVLTPLPGVTGGGASVHLIEPRGEGGSYPGTSWLEFRDLRQRLPSFEDVIAFRMLPLSIGRPDQAERVTGMLVSDNYFTALGLQPAAGVFPRERAGDGATAAEPVAVISYVYWQTRFNGEPSVVGRTLRINDRPFTIVGVASRGFQGTVMGLRFDVWTLATLAPVLLDGTRELENRGQRAYAAIGPLRRGASRAQAQRDLDAALRDLARAHPDTNATITGEVLPFWQSPRGPQRFLVSALAILQAVMLLVLLVVCGNTANLLLARASVRYPEISVRLALGAGRWRIVSLLLCESVLLALLGALAGALIALWGTEALRAVPMPTPGGLTVNFQTSVDAVTLAFAALLGLGCGLAFGLGPALQLSRIAPQAALRAGASAPGRSRLRDVVMIVEVALALVVLVVAALFLKSFNDTRSTDPGFRRDGVLLATYDLRGRTRNIDAADSAQFAVRLLERLRTLPGVESAAIGAMVPLDIHGMPMRSFTLEGRARPDGASDQALSNTVTPGYFATMGIALVTGSDFVDLTDVATAPQAIVNEQFVRRYLDDEAAAVGRRIESAGRTYAIAGVVRDSLYNAYGEPPAPFIYLSYRDRPSPTGEMHLRTRSGAEAAIVPEVRRVVRELNATLPVYNVRTLNEHVDANLVIRRIPARMFAVIGPALLVLAAIGIYAVVAYSVAQRRVEIGMRLALGGTAGRVGAQLVVESVRVIAFGAAAGWVIAFMISRDFLGAAAFDVAIFTGVPAALLAVALFASWLPARRAARLDPLSALRQK
jgi:predicted permease